MSKVESEASELAWRKASRSIGNGECVEVASTSGYVAIRDSKNPEGGILYCSPQHFRSLLDAVRDVRLVPDSTLAMIVCRGGIRSTPALAHYYTFVR